MDILSDYKTTNNTEITKKTAVSATQNVPQWYICRYHRLTDTLRNLSQECPEGFDVFFPFYAKPVKKGKAPKQEAAPILPGYIFVKGNYDSIIRHEIFGHLPVLKYRSDNTPIIVNSRQMDGIVRFADEFREKCFFDIESLRLDIESVSPEENDYVEIVDGQCKGMRGYIKTKERSKQATFYFECSSESDAPSQASPTNLNISFDITRDMIKILRFGTANGHARDFIGKAYNKALDILESMATGQELSPSARRTVTGYIVRFSDVELEGNIKQRANLQRLLLVCHAVLGNEVHFARILSDIQTTLYTEYNLFVDSKRATREKNAAHAALENYKSSIDNILKLYKH